MYLSKHIEVHKREIQLPEMINIFSKIVVLLQPKSA